MDVAMALMLIERRGYNGLVVTEAAAKKAFCHEWAEPFAGTTEQTQDSASIVFAEINRAVKTLPPQGADNGPGLLKARLSTRARHPPNPGQPGQMFKEWGDLLRCQQMQRATLEVLFERAQSRDHQHRITEVAELDGKDLH
jgi:hypothetical protein